MLTTKQRTKMEADPDIAKAMAEGHSLYDIEKPKRVQRQMGARIGMAQYRYGPDHPKVQKAIDEANRVSVMMTTARAAFNRIMRG